MNRKIFVVVFIAIAFGYLYPHHVFAQHGEMDVFLDSLALRVDSYAVSDSFTVKVISENQEMDSHWQPKKVRHVEKIRHRAGDLVWEDIIRATVFEKGQEKDITEKAREKAEKHKETAEKKHRESEKNKNKKNKKGMSLAGDDIFPFDKEKRQNFQFVFGPDTTWQGTRVISLVAKAKIKNEKVFNGTYYINPATLDVVGVRLHPTKNPKFVKSMDLKMGFVVLGQEKRYFLPAFVWTRVYASLLIKKMRFIINEEFSEYKFGNEDQ